jgi:CheY-like chemotaxis protein
LVLGKALLRTAFVESRANCHGYATSCSRRLWRGSTRSNALATLFSAFERLFFRLSVGLAIAQRERAGVRRAVSASERVACTRQGSIYRNASAAVRREDQIRAHQPFDAGTDVSSVAVEIIGIFSETRHECCPPTAVKTSAMFQLTNPTDVLLVDDDPSVRRILRAILTRAGFRVREAVDLFSARARIAENPVEAVILDLGLPDGSGFDLLRELRRGPSGVTVMILTAVHQNGVIQTGYELGANDFMTKPVDPANLVARVRQMQCA